MMRKKLCEEEKSQPTRYVRKHALSLWKIIKIFIIYYKIFSPKTFPFLALAPSFKQIRQKKENKDLVYY